MEVPLAVILVAKVVLLSLFGLYYYINYGEDGVGEPKKETICNTRDCVKTAAMMAKKMNLAADPCQDFHEYACGRFIKETVIPEDQYWTTTLTIIENRNELVMKDILIKEMKTKDHVYLQTIKRFYKSCMDEDQLEMIGLNAYKRDTQFVKDWPTLNPDWNITNFNLDDTMARYIKVYIGVLFNFDVGADPSNSSHKILYLAHPDAKHSQHLIEISSLAYVNYYTDIALFFGAPRSTAKRDALKVLELEKDMFKAVPTLTVGFETELFKV